MHIRRFKLHLRSAITGHSFTSLALFHFTPTAPITKHWLTCFHINVKWNHLSTNERTFEIGAHQNKTNNLYTTIATSITSTAAGIIANGLQEWSSK
jgi:hypothetical protein